MLNKYNFNEGIRVKEIDSCFLCKKRGTTLYKEMRDRIFEAPGLWAFFQCPKCNLVWLSPRPISEDTERVYQRYNLNFSIFYNETSLRSKIRLSLIAANFNSTDALKIPHSKWLRRFFKLIPLIKEVFGKRAIMYLSKSDGKRLLDVGCGGGSFLALMRDLGWEVMGVEPDEKAAEFAQKQLGLKVLNQTFEEANLPSNFFEAVTMRHVIEHVEEPIGFLEKGWQLLKPGGRLVIVTPNIKSLGSLIFKKNWLHLDPPRHFHLFSAETLERCALLSGFKDLKVKIIPAAGEKTYLGSRDIQLRGKYKINQPSSFGKEVKGLLFQFLEIFLSFFWPNLGEEIVLEATKN